MTEKLRNKSENLTKAIARLEYAVEVYQQDRSNQLIEAGLIQNFEFCTELAWKTLKVFLEEKNFVVKSPRDAFKIAFQNGIIKNGEIWLQALDDRNLLSHVYDETQAQNVTQRIVKDYLGLFQNLKQIINE